jgi:hypothetical protein
VAGTTNEEMWFEITAQLGPTTNVSGWEVLRDEYIAEYTSWTTTNGMVPFDKWLIWRYKIGTAWYGNLPKNKTNDGKIGHCWMPCPYSTQSDDLRTRLSLNLSDTDLLPTKVTHEAGGIVHYMTTKGKGPRWGFECPYIGCTHFILTGEKYFYI